MTGHRGAGRYAPSPTGELHLGNLRTAVLAWLFARSTGRRFLLRIEDLDTGRVRPGMAEQQAADLAALGLDFDPPTLVQSARSEVYAAALATLATSTFECFCTRREIAEAASAPHGIVPRYPGTCRNLTAAERADRRQTRAPALRLRADGAEQTIPDLLHGTVTGPVDDIVVRRNDGGGGLPPGRRGGRRRHRGGPGRPRRRPAVVGGQPGLSGPADSATRCRRTRTSRWR